MSGNQKSFWAISPARYAVRDAGSGGQIDRPQLPHPGGQQGSTSLSGVCPFMLLTIVVW